MENPTMISTNDSTPLPQNFNSKVINIMLREILRLFSRSIVMLCLHIYLGLSSVVLTSLIRRGKKNLIKCFAFRLHY